MECQFYSLYQRTPICTYTGNVPCPCSNVCDANKYESPVIDMCGNSLPGPSPFGEIYNYCQSRNDAVQIQENFIKEIGGILNSRQQLIAQNARKKQTTVEIHFNEGRRAELVISYEDGTLNAEYIDALKGVPGCCRVCFEKEINVRKEFFYIIFSNETYNVIGDMTKISQKEYLYNQFSAAGVKFPDNITKSKICDALRHYFIDALVNTENKITVDHLGGWNLETKKYISASGIGNYYKFFQNCGIELPFLDKQFAEYSEYENTYAYYKDCYLNFSSPEQGKLMLVLPYIALLYSLFDNNLRRQIKTVIIRSSLNTECFYPFLSIFQEKMKHNCVLLTESSKDLYKFAASKKDEIVLYVATYGNAESKYLRQVTVEHMKEVINVSSGCTRLPLPYCRSIPALTVIISDFVPTDIADAYVLELEDFETPSDNRLLKKVWSDFINWVEYHFSDTQELLNNRDQVNDDFMVFENTWNVVNKFLISKGIDMGDSPSWNELLTESSNEQDLLNLFKVKLIDILAKHELKFSIKDGRNYYAFATSEWGELLQKLGLAPNKRKILGMLKDSDYLDTEDSYGDASRLFVDGKRREFYKIRKIFFDEPGDLSLKSLLYKEEEYD